MGINYVSLQNRNEKTVGFLVNATSIEEPCNFNMNFLEYKNDVEFDDLTLF